MSQHKKTLYLPLILSAIFSSQLNAQQWGGWSPMDNSEGFSGSFPWSNNPGNMPWGAGSMPWQGGWSTEKAQDALQKSAPYGYQNGYSNYYNAPQNNQYSTPLVPLTPHSPESPKSP